MPDHMEESTRQPRVPKPAFTFTALYRNEYMTLPMMKAMYAHSLALKDKLLCHTVKLQNSKNATNLSATRSYWCQFMTVDSRFASGITQNVQCPNDILATVVMLLRQRRPANASTACQSGCMAIARFQIFFMPATAGRSSSSCCCWLSLSWVNQSGNTS